MPQNIREVKGSFFTPKIWVKKSQEYLGKIFGDNWQDEYYIWECAAGTGNLLAGLKNKYRVWASTLDQPDVDTMHALIDGGLNLLHGHVFQFDFLNDNFDKLPQGLKEIIDNPEKREKLIIYINPPYAEAATAATVYGTGENKAKVSNLLLTHERYANYLGKAGRELFVQFLTRVYFEIGGCKIAEFSKLKTLQSPNFRSFRAVFLARLEKCFVVPAYTFDNVKGKFPIGFKIWDTEKKEEFKETVADVYDENGGYIGEKTYLSCDGVKTINDWLKNFVNTGAALAAMCCKGTDFQNAKYVNVNLPARLKGVGNSKGVTNFTITEKNFAYAAIYYSARHVLPSSWMNDRDQFLYPRDGWEADMEFRNNCLIFFLFNVNTQSAYGVNHWIPFSEMEAGAKEKFTSNFMNRYLKGKTFSPEARALLETGLALYQYYHVKIKENNSASVNASFYDIREFFQGRKENGAMNANSADETYSALMSRLRAAQKIVTAKIAPKIYEYGFLRK
ncbi:MAG: hypothetical protein LBG69_03980 [Zoogloeaceae bacterium]|nr:hypothetical protein [Zoogloeaceae bacterium]